MRVTAQVRRFCSMLLAAVAIIACGSEPNQSDVRARSGANPPAEALESYLSRAFSNGVPYQQSIVYGAAAVPDLLRVLNDPLRSDRWSVAATMLAMIGDFQAVAGVVDFIERREPTFTASSTYRWAQSNAVLALGYAANDHRSVQALTYLLESLSADIWLERGLPGAQGSTGMGVEGSLDAELTSQALLGLALSGTREAGQALERYRDDGSRPDDLRDTAGSALIEHAIVSADGLMEYDRRRWEAGNAE